MTKSHAHLATLDGLRGIAAISVALFHLSYHWPRNIFPHAYLAVDFFFALSGFVIAKSYEHKLQNTMRFQQFLRIRVIRLYPLIVCGAVLGCADVILKTHNGGFGAAMNIALLEQLLLGLLLVPELIIGADQIFPLNPPAWSLFYEMVANIFYAALINHLTNKRLYLIMTIAALSIAYSGYTIGETGRGAAGTEIVSGTSRVMFSFFAGVLLYRMWQRGVFSQLPRVPGLWLGLALLLLFSVPQFHFDWIYNLLSIFFLFPLIVLLGLDQASLSPRFVPAALWLGRISYPLYVLHFPLLVRNSYHLFHARHGLPLVAITCVATLGVVLLSWLGLVLYDEPLRRRLGGRRAAPAQSFSWTTKVS